MQYLPIRTFKSRPPVGDAPGEPLRMDFLCLGLPQMQFLFQTVDKWLATIGHSDLMTPDNINRLGELFQRGQQQEANTASLIRFGLRVADYTKFSTEHLFIANRLDERLGPDIKRHDGYMGIDLSNDEWKKVQEIIAACPSFKKIELVPFLKLIDHPPEEIPSEPKETVKTDSGNTGAETTKAEAK